MARLHYIAAALLSGSVLLGGCMTTHGMDDAERLAAYQAHAGEPVRKVRYYHPIDWNEVDGSHLVITMRPSEQYLMRLSGACLDWRSGPPVISLTSTAGYVTAGFDRLSVSGSQLVCRIEEIRPVDVRAMRAAGQVSGT
jgi:hypothetical protein